MEPTIGRIVYVRIRGYKEIFPAIVCEVHSKICISVQPFGRHNPEFLSSVVQGDVQVNVNEESPGHIWDWMPFQKANS